MTSHLELCLCVDSLNNLDNYIFNVIKRAIYLYSLIKTKEYPKIKITQSLKFIFP